MTFYYPIPAGAAVTCMGCEALLKDHLDERGGWRGCPVEGDGDGVVNPHPVFLISTNRRRAERRRGEGRRHYEHEAPRVELPPALAGDEGVAILERPRIELPQPRAAGPRAAVYLLTPGARLHGQTGQIAAVFERLQTAGRGGLTSREIQKALKMKPKSLESVLHRMRLAGMIRAYNVGDVRGEQ